MGLSAFKGAIPKAPEEDHPPSFVLPVTDSQRQQAEGQEKPPTGAGVDSGAGTTRPKTEAEREADRLYEERIEDEYAKREGGA